MDRVINWFEIPTVNLERAVAFYEKVLSIKLKVETLPNIQMAVFPYPDGATGGGLVKHPMMKPTADGVVVYLNGGDDLAVPLGRVATAGGEVLMQKTLIAPEIGYMGFFRDTEGNTVALHSKG
jgi:predicted enzyme related to lactoylglutathione lyase